MPGSLTWVQTCVVDLQLFFVRPADERGFHRFLLPFGVELRIQQIPMLVKQFPHLWREFGPFWPVLDNSFANLDAPLTDFPNHGSNQVPAVDSFRYLIVKNQFTELRIQQLPLE